MRTIDMILYETGLVGGGAPMGRLDKGTKANAEYNNKKIFNCRVKLNTGGYDKGGAYWGLGTELRVEYTKDLTYIYFYRKQ